MMTGRTKNRGVSLTGYGLLVGLIGVVALLAVTTSGNRVNDLFVRVAGSLEGAGGAVSGGAGGGLSASPASLSGLDVTGPGNPAQGSAVPVTITNDAGSATNALTASTDTPANFVIGADGCSGQSLPASGSCIVEVIPQADSTMGLSGTLQVGDGTASVSVALSGSASGFVGNTFSWGNSSVDAFGSDQVPGVVTSDPTAVDGGLNFVKIAGGYNHSCSIDGNGAAWCWGTGTSGELGNGSNGSSREPVEVSGGLTFSEITVGPNFSCGIAGGGQAWCWGQDNSGALGNGAGGNSNVPGQVQGGHSFVQIGAQSSTVCGATSGGQGYCWGWNSHGQVGNGNTTDQHAPALVQGGLSFAEVQGGTQFSCGRTTSNQVWCWGIGNIGQLGNGAGTNSSTPVQVSGSFDALAVGGAHSCALSGTTARCWGWGHLGRIGHGSTNNALSPATVQGGHSFVQIDAGFYHTCAVTGAGVAWCWGGGDSQKLGNGSTSNQSSPVQVQGGLSFSHVIAGNFTSYGLEQ